MVCGVVFGGLFTFAGLFLPGIPEEIPLQGLEYGPFVLIAVFAYVGLARRWSRAVTWVLVGLTLALGIALMAYLVTDWATDFDGPGATALYLQTTLIFTACLAGCGLAVLRPCRRLWARVLPMNPDRFVHTVALLLVLSGIVLCFYPLVATASAVMLKQAEVASHSGAMDPRIASLVGLVWLVPAVLVASGYGVERNLRGAARRLGLQWPTRRQWLAAVALGVLLVGAAWVVDKSIAELWRLLGWPTTDTEKFNLLIQQFLNLGGAVAIAITAGVGEELLVRGLLQRRLGIVLSNLLFTALHAAQYHWDALLSVFLFGLLLGYIRRRSNTVVCIVIHGLYDFIVVLLTAYKVLS